MRVVSLFGTGYLSLDIVQSRPPPAERSRHGVLAFGERDTPVMMRTTVVPGGGGSVSASASALVPDTRHTFRLIPGACSSFSSRCSIVLIAGFP